MSRGVVGHPLLRHWPAGCGPAHRSSRARRRGRAGSVRPVPPGRRFRVSRTTRLSVPDHPDGTRGQHKTAGPIDPGKEAHD